MGTKVLVDQDELRERLKLWEMVNLLEARGFGTYTIIEKWITPNKIQKQCEQTLEPTELW